VRAACMPGEDQREPTPSHGAAGGFGCHAGRTGQARVQAGQDPRRLSHLRLQAKLALPCHAGERIRNRGGGAVGVLTRAWP
jgi:hypothetical protein